jgi:hypothetical protein
LMTRIIVGDQYRSLSSSLCSLLHSPVTSSLLGPNRHFGHCPPYHLLQTTRSLKWFKCLFNDANSYWDYTVSVIDEWTSMRDWWKSTDKEHEKYWQGTGELLTGDRRSTDRGQEKYWQGTGEVLTGDRNTDRGQEKYWQGTGEVLTGDRRSTDRGQEKYWQGTGEVLTGDRRSTRRKTCTVATCPSIIPQRLTVDRT